MIDGIITTSKDREAYEKMKEQSRLRQKRKHEEDPLLAREIYLVRKLQKGEPVFIREPVDTRLREANRMPDGIQFRLSARMSKTMRERYLFIREQYKAGEEVIWQESTDLYLERNGYINSDIKFVGRS